MINPDGGNFWTYISALAGAVIVVFMAWYKDTRTHKRIDSIEGWVSRVETKNDSEIKKMSVVIHKNTVDLIKDYPDKEYIKGKFEPIIISLAEVKEMLLEAQKDKEEDMKEPIKSLEDEIKKMRNKA